VRQTKFFLTTLLLSAAFLCRHAAAGGPVAGPAGPQRPGVVFILGGIGGMDPIKLWAKLALPWGGVPHEVRDFDWTHGKGRLLRDLQDIRHLQNKAEELAEAVRAVKAAEPDRPVYFVGHSAGAALALMTAEKFPPGTLERVVLLAPAVSDDYDLRPALRATRGEVVSYNSAYDWFFLDWGTTQFGTADRVYGRSAGLNGFQIPDGLCDEDRLLYGRLVQVPWRWDMLLDGRGGAHHSPCMPLFLARHVAPWLGP
jgi:pimeloyl-ACP methyl ester carboxylesterase